jgi:hypothetical protein
MKWVPHPVVAKFAKTERIAQSEFPSSRRFNVALHFSLAAFATVAAQYRDGVAHTAVLR